MQFHIQSNMSGLHQLLKSFFLFSMEPTPAMSLQLIKSLENKSKVPFISFSSVVRELYEIE